jgi:hypothetical protein
LCRAKLDTVRTGLGSGLTSSSFGDDVVVGTNLGHCIHVGALEVVFVREANSDLLTERDDRKDEFGGDFTRVARRR